jgi:hypothetical protein
MSQKDAVDAFYYVDLFKYDSAGKIIAINADFKHPSPPPEGGMSAFQHGVHTGMDLRIILRLFGHGDLRKRYYPNINRSSNQLQMHMR